MGLHKRWGWALALLGIFPLIAKKLADTVRAGKVYARWKKPARFVSKVQHAKEYGMRAASAEFDFADVMERVQRVIATIAPHDSVERYTALGVNVLLGKACIVSRWKVEVTRDDSSTTRLTTRSIVIAAGERPFVPPRLRASSGSRC